MEEWQRQHITRNLPKLISLTEFNCKVNAELLANKILCEIDIDILVNHSVTSAFFEITLYNFTTDNIHHALETLNMYFRLILAKRFF